MRGLRSTRRHLTFAVPGLLLGLLLLLAAAPVVMAADPPANDERAGAAPLIGDETMYTSYDLAGSTAAPDDPALCGPGGSNLGSIWFAYTPTSPDRSSPWSMPATTRPTNSTSLAPGGGELGCAVAQPVWPSGTVDSRRDGWRDVPPRVVGPTIDSETVGQVVDRGRRDDLARATDDRPHQRRGRRRGDVRLHVLEADVDGSRHGPDTGSRDEPRSWAAS